MFKLQKIVLVIALFGAAAVHCAKWPRPQHYSSESISTSLSSEEYHGVALPPLQLGGVPLPNPVHSNNNVPVVVPTYPYKPNPLASAQFTELFKANIEQINQAAGPNRRFAHISKVKQIPVPDAEMYYIKAYYNNDFGHRNKCTFFMYSKEGVTKLMDVHCY